MNWKFTSAICICVFNLIPVYSQQKQLKFKTISTQNGLSRSIAWNLAQDGKGFIWVGTFGGLNQYDGYRFKVYKNIPADSNSLINGFVSSLFCDSRNRLWVGTPDGLDQYDSGRDAFRHYKPTVKAGGKSLNITWIYEDQQRKIWVGTGEGIHFFDEHKQRLRRDSLWDNAGIARGINAFIQDKAGNYWLGSEEGLFTYHPSNGPLNGYRRLAVASPGLAHDHVNTLFEDSRGNLWIGTRTGLTGWDPVRQALVHYSHNPSDPASISHNFVTCIAEDREGNLWVGTNEGGLNKLDYPARTFTRMQHNAKDPYSLADNFVRDVLPDAKGGVWVATFRGMSYFDPYQSQFDWLRHEGSDSNSMPDSYTTALLVDKKGEVWLGTGKGISRYNPQNRQFTNFSHQAGNEGFLGEGAVTGLAEDKDGHIWSLTHLGKLSRLDRKRNVFVQYEIQPGNSAGSPGNPVCLYADKDGKVWLGSRGAVYGFDTGRNTFSRFPLPTSLEPVRVESMFEDLLRNFWVLTGDGIYLFDRRKQTFTPSPLPIRASFFMYEDRNRNLWFASTFKGLYFYDVATRTVKNYTVAEGLPDNSIQGILEDKRGNIWLSTTNGLCRLNPQTGQYKVFTVWDDLNKEFNARACGKTASGTMYFGGTNGVNVFTPEHIRDNPHPPAVWITDFQLFNRPVSISRASPLQKAITETRQLNLSYRQSVLSFEFVGLHYTSPAKNQYAYKMEGFDKDWIYAGTRRHATYTNLPPGKTYVFRVKAANNDGIWNQTGASLPIYISPPFWQTWWFYGGVSLALLTALYLLHQLRTRQMRRQQKKLEHMVRVQTEKLEAQKEELAVQTEFLTNANQEISEKNQEILQQAAKLKEIDQLKSRFFANISHEFRTPLTLLLGPLEEMRLTAWTDSSIHLFLEVMHRNGQRLRQLINQLLDLSKIEAGSMPLKLINGNLVEYLQTLSHSFDYLAQSHQIHYQFVTDTPEILSCFDADKVAKIVGNLLSNAFKFTPDGGSITVRVSLTAVHGLPAGPEAFASGEQRIRISIQDNGIGIAPERLAYVFDRFYQADQAPVRRSEGSGIGLALTKELTELHGGSISVQSEPGKGTRFTVLLPYTENGDSAPAESPQPANQPESTGQLVQENTPDRERVPVLAAGENAPLLLIAEDNFDLRQLIRRSFASYFRTAEAADGTQAWDKALASLPDLVVSDVMMPGQDGFALCKQLKNDARTSHIPVILLTARTDAEEEGLQLGADDYIVKPFNPKALVLKVKNLLEARQKLRQAIREEIGGASQPESSQLAFIHAQDQQFLENITGIIHHHLQDTKFELETLYRELGMGRNLVYKKLKALTGLSPNEFIRHLRLSMAAKLLAGEGLSLPEVMARVGFNHRSYFIKCFREQFGCSPAEYSTTHECRSSQAADSQ